MPRPTDSVEFDGALRMRIVSCHRGKVTVTAVMKEKEGYILTLDVDDAGTEKRVVIDANAARSLAAWLGSIIEPASDKLKRDLLKQGRLI